MADLQNKLSELEKSQTELVAENASLKDLCQYLNEQQDQIAQPDMSGAAVGRDSGDGSSASSLSLDKQIMPVSESTVSLSPRDAQPNRQQLVKGILLAMFIQLYYVAEEVSRMQSNDC